MGNVVKILTATDLHRGKQFYDELTQAVAGHNPNVVALVGDFLDVLETIPEQYSNPEAPDVLSKLTCQEIVFVRGNHEDFDWWNFADAWAKTGRELIALHGELFLHGPLAMVGFPCGLGDETAYLGSREPLPESPDKWLSKFVKSYGPVMRTLWLMHEPPTRTPLTVGQGPLAGNPAWNEALARFSPLLTISGHDHQSPISNQRWYCRVGQTTCVNLGQSVDGPLHYGLIEAEFSKDTPCLPTRMRVTAYPSAETFDVVGTKNELDHQRIVLGGQTARPCGAIWSPPNDDAKVTSNASSKGRC